MISSTQILTKLKESGFDFFCEIDGTNKEDMLLLPIEKVVEELADGEVVDSCFMCNIYDDKNEIDGYTFFAFVRRSDSTICEYSLHFCDCTFIRANNELVITKFNYNRIESFYEIFDELATAKLEESIINEKSKQSNDLEILELSDLFKFQFLLGSGQGFKVYDLFIEKYGEMLSEYYQQNPNLESVKEKILSCIKSNGTNLSTPIFEDKKLNEEAIEKTIECFASSTTPVEIDDIDKAFIINCFSKEKIPYGFRCVVFTKTGYMIFCDVIFSAVHYKFKNELKVIFSGGSYVFFEKVSERFFGKIEKDLCGDKTIYSVGESYLKLQFEKSEDVKKFFEVLCEYYKNFGLDFETLLYCDCDDEDTDEMPLHIRDWHFDEYEDYAKKILEEVKDNHRDYTIKFFEDRHDEVLLKMIKRALWIREYFEDTNYEVALDSVIEYTKESYQVKPQTEENLFDDFDESISFDVIDAQEREKYLSQIKSPRDKASLRNDMYFSFFANDFSMLDYGEHGYIFSYLDKIGKLCFYQINFKIINDPVRGKKLRIESEFNDEIILERYKNDEKTIEISEIVVDGKTYEVLNIDSYKCAFLKGFGIAKKIKDEILKLAKDKQ